MALLARELHSMNTNIIGQISLNISLVLYLTNYIPQLFHNHKGVHLSGLSIYFHTILFFSCFMDLFYGFGMHLPWQYKTVSISWLCYLYFQHRQISASAHMFSGLKKINIILMSTVVVSLC